MKRKQVFCLAELKLNLKSSSRNSTCFYLKTSNSLTPARKKQNLSQLPACSTVAGAVRSHTLLLTMSLWGVCRLNPLFSLPSWPRVVLGVAASSPESLSSSPPYRHISISHNSARLPPHPSFPSSFSLSGC